MLFVSGVQFAKNAQRRIDTVATFVRSHFHCEIRRKECVLPFDVWPQWIIHYCFSSFYMPKFFNQCSEKSNQLYKCSFFSSLIVTCLYISTLLSLIVLNSRYLFASIFSSMRRTLQMFVRSCFSIITIKISWMLKAKVFLLKKGTMLKKKPLEYYL